MAYSNQYAQKIFSIMQPLIGDLMSKGALRTQCSHLGITEETIQQKDLSELSDKLKKGLIIFLGSDGANQVATRIKMLQI